MKQPISISESEWQVMKIVWSEPPKTLQRDSVQLEEHQMEHNYHTNISGPSRKKRSAFNRASRQGVSVLSCSVRAGLSVGRGPDLSQPRI